MTTIIGPDHPINTPGSFQRTLDMTAHQDGTFTLRANAEVLRDIEHGFNSAADMAHKFRDAAWTTPAVQAEQTKRNNVMARAIRDFRRSKSGASW